MWFLECVCVNVHERSTPQVINKTGRNERNDIKYILKSNPVIVCTAKWHDEEGNDDKFKLKTLPARVCLNKSRVTG